MIDITELKISPVKDSKKKIADFVVTFNNSISSTGCIRENKEGIYVTFPASFGIKTPEIKKQISNRILATYVINHCVDDYEGD